MTDDLIIPVRIIAVDAERLTLDIPDNAEVCPRCARGEGCGARPWFRGFFRAKRMVLPRSGDMAWQAGDDARLQVAARVLQRLLYLVYGVPLAVFLLTLLVLHDVGEFWQLCAAIVATLFAATLARRHGERRLARALRLLPETNTCVAAPQKYP